MQIALNDMNVAAVSIQQAYSTVFSNRHLQKQFVTILYRPNSVNDQYCTYSRLMDSLCSHLDRISSKSMGVEYSNEFLFYLRTAE